MEQSRAKRIVRLLAFSRAELCRRFNKHTGGNYTVGGIYNMLSGERGVSRSFASFLRSAIHLLHLRRRLQRMAVSSAAARVAEAGCGGASGAGSSIGRCLSGAGRGTDHLVDRFAALIENADAEVITRAIRTLANLEDLAAYRARIPAAQPADSSATA